tara:strand:+ start:731 stop:1192 length:462 start_codon:yes stop_codon:yes gene_type:complete
MATYIRYKIATGEIDCCGTTETDILPFDVPNGYATMQGYGSNQTNYVANNAIQDYTIEQQVTKANKPTYKCVWSNTTFTWNDTRTPEEQNSAAESQVIATRDMLLDESDWIVVRAVDQGTPIPTDWQTYRQALRDITNQSGYPTNVVWPVAPF